jgi:sialidase-1
MTKTEIRNTVIQIHPYDNVVVVLTALKRGTAVSGYFLGLIKPCFKFIFAMLFACVCLFAKGQDKSAIINTGLPYSSYYTLGNQLNNFKHVIVTRKNVIVTFLGGSITYNPGWRQMVCKYLTDKFPNTDFHFIAAGIPSLGSLPHAFRLQRDVLDSGKTDLMFIEAAVNDRVNHTDSITQVRALEGIVRHAKRSNPGMDFIIMAFADPYKTSDYNKGLIPPEIANHQMVAEHYNLPFINLGKEVRDKINNKEFSWEGDFKDIHPAPFGQQLYFENIKSLLSACFDSKAKKIIKSPLPKPMDKANFEYGSYYNIRNASYSSGWAIDNNWKPTDGLGTRDGFVNVPVLSSVIPGSTLSLLFNGTAVGIAIVSGSDAGIISYRVDNGPENTVDLYTEWSSMLHLPWYMLLGSDLKTGNHTLTITISQQKNKNSKGNACRIVNFLVNK